jgi:hypothetical protein
VPVDPLGPGKTAGGLAAGGAIGGGDFSARDLQQRHAAANAPKHAQKIRLPANEPR